MITPTITTRKIVLVIPSTKPTGTAVSEVVSVVSPEVRTSVDVIVSEVTASVVVVEVADVEDEVLDDEDVVVVVVVAGTGFVVKLIVSENVFPASLVAVTLKRYVVFALREAKEAVLVTFSATNIGDPAGPSETRLFPPPSARFSPLLKRMKDTLAGKEFGFTYAWMKALAVVTLVAFTFVTDGGAACQLRLMFPSTSVPR